METWIVPYTTAVGTGWVEVSDKGICRVFLPTEEAPGGTRASGPAPAHAAQAADQLQRYFAGQLRRFDLPLDIGSLTPFQERVLAVACRIPYGTVISYRRLAELAGHPKAARAAGGVMAANRLPVIIPCHRVVSSTGALTGYSGAGGISCKKLLLTMEGVEFRGEKNCRIFDSY
ncbi:methylated-DNA--[protein]-cysteine S-methyltransferase [Trichlorobacter ammonificans]|uniref:Methylated-DNA--protein-cysteine methyltransferase n=1 Tax=Trichlorobacter ammonificans TaxID=2916410 RepID=A0ABN8HH54_9BACT|nr:methylated-DNA--[protein]-cysteine S-methyltransferase [Trichlorobacter ammonificans]CAH2030809.1 Methylated-DNA--protein-cysteine methyltransferase [Trichlorobacter ammonificans]